MINKFRYKKPIIQTAADVILDIKENTATILQNPLGNTNNGTFVKNDNNVTKSNLQQDIIKPIVQCDNDRCGNNNVLDTETKDKLKVSCSIIFHLNFQVFIVTV